MELRTLYCSVKGCEREIQETKPGGGFPGWGHVDGLMEDETGEMRAHLCPEHLQKVKWILNGGDVS